MDTLKPEIMDYLEDKLDELVDNTNTKFPDHGAEIAVACASVAAQMGIKGEVDKETFIHMMSQIWDCYEEDNKARIKRKRLMN